MSVPLPESIIEKVARRFLQKDQAEALRMLAEYRCNDEALRDRILHCVLSLAGKEIDRLKHLLDCAREDHRNLIMWQEHAEQSRNQFFKE